MKSARSHTQSSDQRSNREDENALIQACQLDDRDAHRRLYEHYGEKVFRLMVRMVGRQEAVDLTQQVFLQVYRKIHQFSGKSQFHTWLYRVAVNEALQYKRRNRSRPTLPLLFEPASSTDSVDSYETKESLENALATIEPDLRAIFLLREVDRLSYSQLAEILQIPAGTVASRLNRARRELKAELERHDTS